MPGPVPKRDAERIRRNIPDVPTDVIEMVGDVEIPDLDLVDPHPLIVDFYESLKDSGQSKYYEPSDWQHARIVCHFLDSQVKSSKPSGQMLATLHSMMGDMLVAEGQRRRVRLEIEREQATAQVINISDLFKERFSSASAEAS